MRLFPRSLPYRLASLLVITHVVLTLVLYLGLNEADKLSINESTNQQREFDSFLISLLTQPLLFEEDFTAEVNSLFTDILVGGKAAYLELNSEEGLILNKTLAPIDTRQLYFNTIDMGSNDDYNNIVLQVGFDQKPLAEKLQKAYDDSLFIVMIFCLLSIVTTFILTYRLVRPIKQLQNMSKEVSSGHIDSSLLLDHPVHEIDQLSQDMESMRLSLRKHSQDMEYISLHDDLTNLPNRRMLYANIDQTLSSAASKSDITNYSLALINLNNFKSINDVYGHHIGDQALIKASQRIAKILDGNTTFARLGGDEFAIFTKNQQLLTDKFIHEIQSQLQQELVLGDIKIRLDINAGIATFPTHASNRIELLQRANIAMYASKREGRTYTIYDETLHTYTAEQFSIRSDLRYTIKKQLFELHYQPKVCIKTGKLHGFEALCRWKHQKYGYISPEVFIPLLEEMHLIGHLSSYVLDTALSQLHSWVEFNPKLVMSINLSPLDLLNPNLIEHLQEKMREYSLRPENIEIEITESANIIDNNFSQQTLEKINDLGISLAVDDFGTGYTSLSYLKDYPISTLKIDKSFVTNMLLSREDQLIVEATINLAHTFDINVVAEGIENQETLQHLKTMGCEVAQGYYFSKPIDSQQATDFIEKFDAS